MKLFIDNVRVDTVLSMMYCKASKLSLRIFSDLLYLMKAFSMYT